MALHKPINALVFCGLTLFVVSVFIGTEEDGGVVTNATAMIVANGGGNAEPVAVIPPESVAPQPRRTPAAAPVTWVDDDEPADDVESYVSDDTDEWGEVVGQSGYGEMESSGDNYGAPSMSSQPSSPTSRSGTQRNSSGSSSSSNALGQDLQRGLQ